MRSVLMMMMTTQGRRDVMMTTTRGRRGVEEGANEAAVM
jgi:hypothetical protein